MAKKLVRSNLSDDAYFFLRDLFLNNKRYNPGDKISVEELSRELGVSRTPLWGAINRLEAEGIVEIVPRLGVYLIDYDPQRILDIYLSREALEGMAARLAAEKITKREIEALRDNIDQQRKHLKDRKFDAYHESVVDFHSAIVQIAGSKSLQTLIDSIFAQIRAMRVQRSSAPMHLPQSCDAHGEILEALERKKPDAAEKVMREHIRDLMTVLEQEITRPSVQAAATSALRRSASRQRS